MSEFQRVLFTALPNGLVLNQPDKYRLSVHISPKLSSTQSTRPLTAYPDWIHWPTVVNTFTWTVQFGAGSPIAATRVSAPADVALWDKMFSSSTVRSFNQPRYHNRRVRSYPARNIRRYIRDKYGKTAVEDAEDYPSYDKLLDEFSELTPSHLFLTPNGNPPGQATVEEELDANKAFVNGTQPERVDFYQLFRFHRSRKNLGPGNRPDNPNYTPLPPPTAPALDFHQAVSTAGQYPTLLRLLGLVVDLEITVNPLPGSPTEVKALTNWIPNVLTPGPNSGPVIGSVRTRCEIDAGAFIAQPADPAEFSNRRLPLSDTDRFTVVQEDLDGGGLKLMDLIANFLRMQVNGKLSSASAQSYSVPSLRSGGLSIARLNLAKRFHDDMVEGTSGADQAEGADPNALVVNAEQITRGLRIDVRDELDGKWFSLTARTGAYKFPSTAPIPFTDEGWVTTAPTEDDSPDKDLYLQETLFQWGGWSLAAPRPGARLNTAQSPATTSAPNAAGPDFPVLIDQKAKPGSLPRLRFGRRYRIRARAVDLAGNSDPIEPVDGDDRISSPEITYRRFEPVQTPPVLFYAPRTQGESLEHVVLRSNYNTEPDPPEVSRHIVPPKADQLLAEKHGLFDTGFPASVVNPASYPMITKYPSLTPPAGPVVQSEQGNFLLSSQGVQDPDAHNKVLYFPVDLVSLPYLPDPIARGLTLFFEKSENPPPAGTLKAPFTPNPAWPAHQPWRLIVQAQGEVAGPPTFDLAARKIFVKLNKAEVARIRLSAFVNGEDLEKLGIWELIEEQGASAQLQQTVLNGRHWMITPFRTLTLVHAVRQPLQLAQLVKAGPNPHFGIDERQLGDTNVKFHGWVNYSRKSTVRIDIVSSWGEFVDNGPKTGDPTPESAPLPRRIQPFSIPGDRGQIGDFVLANPATDRQDFNDTKHRTVNYTTIATTRFAEYFTQTQLATVNYGPDGFFGVTLATDGKGVVPGSVKVRNPVKPKPDGSVADADYGTYVEGPHYSVDVAAGTVVFNRDTNSQTHVPPGKQVLITYLVPPLVRPGPNESADVATLNIPSTSPPAAPKLMYVVPAFKWEKTTGNTFGTGTSKRGGRILRVFLERPWWSSGEGELLGVVINSSGNLTDARLSKVTQWGVDPAFLSVTPGADLPTLVFPRAVKVGPNLQIPGLPGTFAAVGHEVHFDKSRDVWYSDIEVNSKGYFPFIRLALVRYQPDSVAGAEISNVIVTDFAQLAPDRTVTVTPGSPASSRRKVQVTGPTFTRQNAAAAQPLVRVTVERQTIGQNTDLGWRAVGSPETLTRTGLLADGVGVWEGQVKVVAQGGGFSIGPPIKQRLVIEEFERHVTGAGPAPALRLVFSDVFQLGS